MDRGVAILVFDIGKTNKKAFLLDEQYQIIVEDSIHFEEITDEEGFPCDDLARLRQWVIDSCARMASQSYSIKGVNISAYGASLVHLDASGKVLTPMYNYLKPFSAELKERFYKKVGGEERFSIQTASPSLGNLNSGLQLYWLKNQDPHLFTQVKYSLHLPQYVSWLLSRKPCSEITSIGCHTALWDFARKDYHSWVYTEGIAEKLPPIVPADSVLKMKGSGQVGTGLHDSSAALIPYLIQFNEPFVLLSTGTWSISLNPFSTHELSVDELRHDCLCYLDYHGNPVKAARLFAGHEHEEQTKRLASHFHTDTDTYRSITFRPDLIQELIARSADAFNRKPSGTFESRDLSSYETFEEAYHQLMLDIILEQRASTARILEDHIHTIFVDGGFSRNSVFMNLLAAAFPDKKVFGTTIHQASAMGAALVIHQHWNNMPVPRNSIQLKLYPRDLQITF